MQAILRLHKLWLEGDPSGVRAHLERANLERANLCGANLWRANLRGANLRGANLRFANLRHADLSNADLRGANLRGATLIGADLRHADLIGANLEGADLRFADLDCISHETRHYTCRRVGDFLSYGCETHRIDDDEAWKLAHERHGEKLAAQECEAIRHELEETCKRS
jgi:hypothetical protein